MQKMKTTKEKVEDWLRKAPVELKISLNDVEQLQRNVILLGKMCPDIIKGPYEGNITFECEKWEEE